MVLSGPPVEDALAEWPFDAHVVKLTTAFSRAGGFKTLLETAITTPPEQSLVCGGGGGSAGVVRLPVRPQVFRYTFVVPGATGEPLCCAGRCCSWTQT